MDHPQEHDHSRPETPHVEIIPTSESSNSADQGTPPATSPDTSGPRTLPLPAPVLNKSQSSYTLQEVVNESEENDPLPPEIAGADISIAPDGSFVETSSGPAARELKRRYDQRYGVGMNVRSPYAITAFVNQHGKQMYRIGHRDLTAPAAASIEFEDSMSPRDSLQAPPRSKRRSRMSVHTFLPKLSGGTPPSRPQTATSSRKLRKTRSIPDLYGTTSSDTNGASTSTGRAHSQSVTAADMPRPSSFAESIPYRGDIFAETMQWPLPSLSSSSQLSSGSSPTTPESSHRFPSIIHYPFGPEVSFDSPSRKPPSFIPTPRLLREMQSFESILTARQADGRSTIDEPKTPQEEPPEQNRPPSAIRIRPTIVAPSTPTPPQIEFAFAFETMHSRYSTDVFDVLQTYRGLPLLDRLSPESEEGPVIKMSLSSDDTAAPRDDPRFVIWGEVQSENDGDDVSISQGSIEHQSSVRSSNLSRKRSMRVIKGKAPETLPPSRPSPGIATKKVLVAATIERWIAQLTSDLNYDELLDFFMTYRTYINAVDLCHLLICRFHWALAQSNSPKDERVRRIVRVRTFVAIRYWLLTFFVVDFTPNRELRLLVANWLNTLVRDPTLQKHNDGFSIVRKLRRVAKECRKANTRSNSSKPRPSASRPETSNKQEHVLGEKFAEATRRLRPGDEDDSDVDLDFLDDAIPDVPEDDDPTVISHSDAHEGVASSRPTSIPLSSLSILQQTNRAPGPGPEPEGPFIQTPATLPIHHSTLSRVIVKTIGRLGRWRRVLNSRTTTRPPLGACGDVSAFDLELTAQRDLLTVNGGVEQYLKMIEPTPRIVPIRDSVKTLPPATQDTDAQPSSSDPPAASSPPSYDDAQSQHSPVPQADDDQVEPLSPPGLEPDALPASSVTTEVASVHSSSPRPQSTQLSEAGTEDRPASFMTSSTDSFGAPLPPGASTFRSGPTPWGFDVVSIDDLELSDTEDDEDPSAPPGIHRPARRLPLRRDFEFVRRDTVSSISMMSRDSVASVVSETSNHEAPALGGLQQWQVNAIVDSLSVDGEGGDVEDALRRLEGQINPQRQQEKAMKVDGWIRSIQERMAAGDYVDELPRFPMDDDDDYDDIASQYENDDALSTNGSIVISPSSPMSQQQADRTGSPTDFVSTPTATKHTIPSRPASVASIRHTSDARTSLDEAVPLEIQQSRLSASVVPAYPARFVDTKTPRIHQSFVLTFKADTLAEHFAMIDRELFLGLRFEELVLDDWKSCEEVNVLDWSQYLKDRARWKAEGRHVEKTTALSAIRGRFNLVANYVLSELVLSQPSNRPIVFSKFIRIAWKSYELSSFHTLVAIMAGLQTPWAERAMSRHWGRVGMYEMRMYNDLKVWTTPEDDFKFMRHTIESIADNKPTDMSSHATSVISGGGTNRSRNGSDVKPVPTACVPFIGVYLSQLHRFSKLPDLIDPSAPNEGVGIDLVTGNFESPAHPEVFDTLAPLPPSMHLEPLINVHKQRKIARVIKSLVAGQHLASRVQFQIDKKLFQRCLKLRALDEETLQRAYAMHD
ncbi:hypothetical protein ONZ45_g3746 [Pleurotus djamor]|nr:hypothetical protein ONZ45_g3746 [Pleurotus djamor]